MAAGLCARRLVQTLAALTSTAAFPWFVDLLCLADDAPERRFSDELLCALPARPPAPPLFALRPVDFSASTFSRNTSTPLLLPSVFAVFKCSDWLVANLTRNPTFLALRERLHPYRILSESGPPFGTIQRFFSLRVLTSGTSCSPPRPHRTSKAATCFFFPISE